MVGQVGRRARHTVPGQVAGRRRQHAGRFREPPHRDARVGLLLARADRHVDALRRLMDGGVLGQSRQRRVGGRLETEEDVERVGQRTPRLEQRGTLDRAAGCDRSAASID